MLNPTETHGREKSFFMPQRCSSSHGLWLSVSVCVSMHVGKRKRIQEWMEMSLSDSGLHMNPLQNGHIGSLCVLSERACWGSAVSPPHRVLTVVIGARRDTSLYFILFIWGRPFHLPHTCFPLNMCLFSPMVCLAMEASHLFNIGNRNEGLLKQTQYPKPLCSLYELCRE